MKNRAIFLSVVYLAGLASAAAAQGQAMTGAELQSLLAGGKVIGIGGPAEGYTGSLELKRDGRGEGSVKTDAGEIITLSGTWVIRGDAFCRIWMGLGDGNEVCETWVKTGPTSVDVMNGDAKIGVNYWN